MAPQNPPRKKQKFDAFGTGISIRGWHIVLAKDPAGADTPPADVVNILNAALDLYAAAASEIKKVEGSENGK